MELYGGPTEAPIIRGSMEVHEAHEGGDEASLQGGSIASMEAPLLP